MTCHINYELPSSAKLTFLYQCTRQASEVKKDARRDTHIRSIYFFKKYIFKKVKYFFFIFNLFLYININNKF